MMWSANPEKSPLLALYLKGLPEKGQGANHTREHLPRGPRRRKGRATRPARRAPAPGPAPPLPLRCSRHERRMLNTLTGLADSSAPSGMGSLRCHGMSSLGHETAGRTPQVTAATSRRSGGLALSQSAATTPPAPPPETWPAPHVPPAAAAPPGPPFLCAFGGSIVSLCEKDSRQCHLPEVCERRAFFSQPAAAAPPGPLLPAHLQVNCPSVKMQCRSPEFGQHRAPRKLPLLRKALRCLQKPNATCSSDERSATKLRLATHSASCHCSAMPSVSPIRIPGDLVEFDKTCHAGQSRAFHTRPLSCQAVHHLRIWTHLAAEKQSIASFSILRNCRVCL